MMRLLRPPHIGIFLRSFHSHSTHYAREMIAEICSMWGALATAIISQTGSYALLSACNAEPAPDADCATRGCRTSAAMAGTAGPPADHCPAPGSATIFSRRNRL